MKIAYTGNFPYPGASAATTRVEGIATALAEAGHQVHLLPFIPGSGDVADDLPFAVDGHFARQLSRSRVGRQADLLWRRGSGIEELSDPSGIYDLVLVYGAPALALWRSQRQRGTAQRAPVVPDIVEWYSYRSRPLGPFGPVAAEHWLAMNRVVPKSGNIITISSYLADYFKMKACKTIIVPPIMRIKCTITRDCNELHSIRIVYAGSPGMKDSKGLSKLYAAMATLPPALRTEFTLEIVGLTRSEFASVFRGTRNDIRVNFHGRVSRHKAREIVSLSDFTFLHRPNRRYANAGFPTKVVESLLLGTPVLTNETSDLGRYLTNDWNAVILSEDADSPYAEHDIANRLREIYQKVDGFRERREAIVAQAKDAFDPAVYSVQLDEFVRGVVAELRA